jgi:hypothetical protein
MAAHEEFAGSGFVRSVLLGGFRVEKTSKEVC